MNLGDLALSPDGRRLAFTADTGGVLWIRTLDGAAAQPSTVGGDAAYPFWSPDGRFVAFFSDGKLKKVDSAGGMIQTICDAEAGGGGSWGPDGTILFAPSTASALYRVSASGGQPVAVTKLDASRHETYHRYPFFLPDGRHFLYVARGTTTPPIRSASPRSTGSSTRRSCQRAPMPSTQRDICSMRRRARCPLGRSISAGSKRQETLFRSRRVWTCTSGITFSSARRSACWCSPVARPRRPRPCSGSIDRASRVVRSASRASLPPRVCRRMAAR